MWFNKNKTNNLLSSNNHPSAKANKAIHCLKWGGATFISNDHSVFVHMTSDESELACLISFVWNQSTCEERMESKENTMGLLPTALVDLDDVKKFDCDAYNIRKRTWSSFACWQQTQDFGVVLLFVQYRYIGQQKIRPIYAYIFLYYLKLIYQKIYFWLIMNTPMCNHRIVVII